PLFDREMRLEVGGLTKVQAVDSLPTVPSAYCPSSRAPIRPMTAPGRRSRRRVRMPRSPWLAPRPPPTPAVPPPMRASARGNSDEFVRRRDKRPIAPNYTQGTKERNHAQSKGSVQRV